MGRRTLAQAVLVSVGLTVVIATLATCGVNGIGDSPPSTLHVVRFSTMVTNHYLPLDRTTSQASVVRKLYTLILALPHYPSGTYGCAADFGLQYKLTFTANANVTHEVVASPQGCHGLTIDGGDDRQATDAFWSQLAATVGVPESDLLILPT